jgi:phenylalanyl-tRNA synthetase beta chain
MKISIEWLKSLLPTEASAQEISDLLSVSGLEVEHLEPWFSSGNGLSGFVVGEVMSCVPHPNADRLRVTTVNVGAESLLPIVCGAPNVAAGQKVVVALVGTEIVMPGKEAFVIGKAKIRGEVSEGMICAEDECGMGGGHDGILVLDSSAVVGMPASEYFGVVSDTVIEIGLTANRGDAASHLGVANDLAALLGVHFERIKYTDQPQGGDVWKGKAKGLDVEIADGLLCERYIAVRVEGVVVGESPAFVKHRLRAIGIEPRNNVVDATNYFLHQNGQPVHAFDADRIVGNIQVRLAKAGETLVLLDGKSIQLHESDVVIADGSGAIALAGVMGGLSTAVTAETKNVLVEVAHFHPTYVRKSAKRHNLHTDAGFRFERGIDKAHLLNTARMVAEHLEDYCAGRWVATSEEYSVAYAERKIELSVAQLCAFAGMEIPSEEVVKILGHLGFGVEGGDTVDGIWVAVPSWRNDVEQVVDLYEEVMRIYGYDRVPMDGKLQATLGTFEGMKLRKSENAMRQYLSDQGMLEAATNSLHPAAWYPGKEDLVHLSNPLSSDMDVMRASIIPGLLQSVAYNINRRAEGVQLFELGRIYQKTAKGFRETPTLAMVFWGNAATESWESGAKSMDYFHVKRLVQGVLKRLGGKADVDQIEIFAAPKAWLKAADIQSVVWCVEFAWRKHIGNKAETMKMVAAPKFPGMRRDLSLVVEKSLNFASLKDVVKGVKLPLLQDVRVFDVFEGKPLDANKKAVALSFHFLNAEATLTDVEVDACMLKLMKAFETAGATIRK